MRQTLSLLSLGLTVVLSGCASTPELSSTRTTMAVSPDRDATGVDIEYRHRNHGGVLRLIAVSLRELDLTAGQRASLEQLQAELLTALEPTRAAGGELAAVLANGVAGGAVDRPEAELAAARLRDASAASRAVMTAGLDRLHATLSPEQRATLATKMDALWARWQEESTERSASPEVSDLAILAEKLGLSPDQTSRIQARFAAEMRGVVAEYYPSDAAARAHAFIQAFVADGFSATTTHPPVVEPPAGFGAARMIRFFDAFAPELSAPQRTKLAEMIREHASRHDQS